MKRSALALVLSLITLTLGGCQQAAPETNRNAALATASPVKETFDAAAIEAELIRLERQWAEGTRTKNAALVRDVLADDAVIVYPDGNIATKADEIRTIEAGTITTDTFETTDPTVTVLDADSAFITGRSILKNATYKDPNQKRPINISGEYRFLDVYERRNGKWQAVASHVVKIAAPAR